MKLYTLIIGAAIALSACSGGNGEASTDANDEQMGDTTSLVLESGLQVDVYEKGDGILPQMGQKVSVHYKGMLENGQVFDESYGRGEPITFQIGVGQVIPGWDKGIGQLSKGAKAKLTIPSNLAYGPQERPGIPANSTLIFEVEVMDIQDGPKPIAHESWSTDGLELKTTQSGLQYYIIEEGNGAKTEPGKMVSVHYHGMLEDGTKFDSSFERGEPIEFPLGVGQVIPGWDEGISLLNVGTKAKLVIPSHLAYGERGAGGVIPPNATLVFDVEIVAVK
jgi:peptidylprolyl isomerase